MKTTMFAAPLLALTLALPTAALAQTKDGADAQIVAPQGTLAETAPEVQALLDTMLIPDMFAVLSAEGIRNAAEMEADMFPGQGGSAWQAVVADIYATDRIVAAFEAEVPVELFTGPVVAELAAFFETDLGQRIVEGELGARRAFLEPGAEEAARDMAMTYAAENDPRIEILTEFIVVNDLVERNVMGALNSNFAFYSGLDDGGAFETDIPENLMLAEVWAQEGEIRSDSTEWLYGFQVIAYADISDDEMRAYIDLSRSEAGAVLNQALFAAFDVVFDRISYELGSAAAVFISGEET